MIYNIVAGLFFWCTALMAVAPPSRSTAGCYLKMLQRKPALAHLFERFYNAWNESEYGSLELFLKRNVKKSDTGGISALWLLARLYEKEGQDSKAALGVRLTAGIPLISKQTFGLDVEFIRVPFPAARMIE
ncbi:MAG: hypothetical protein L3J71_15570 [Victivallaceae bacterium]|nr:hypothetical protein [Victivallaceae bacterium]